VPLGVSKDYLGTSIWAYIGPVLEIRSSGKY
jgi:hypothetical protein